MHSEVNVAFNEEQIFRLAVTAGEAMTSQAARDWLDHEFVQHGAQPINPVGKVPLADKVLCVARDAGPEAFQNRDWAQAFAQATVAALGRAVVRIDVASMTVAY